MADSLMTTYQRLPVAFERGEGAWLWDTEGNRYLDAVTGVAVCGLGHAHPEIAKALCDQASSLLHTSNLYRIPLQETLGERLCSLSSMEKAFFANSGAEANEAAIKIARLYGNKREIKNPAIIVMEQSFHGRTLATLSATGNRKVQAGFEPLVQGFIRVPYDDIGAIEEIALHQKNVVAVLVEPVQGEGGVNIPSVDYLNRIREICDQNQWLMMLDEIQTGIGRTGKLFAHQHNGILPDVMTLAKGLGNGMPIGACLARGEAANILAPGNHGSTFGGNPLACRVAMSVLDVVESQQLADRAAKLGQRFQSEFEAKLAELPGVASIRSHGLMVGIELERPCAELVGKALEQNLLINVTAGNVIRLLPPMILNDDECKLIIDKVSALVADFL
ncbi:MAG: aspartate aminotransferase family protein [Candidatus Thiodiazotropha lotti]|uniref:Acetylornithine aminotransferase n=1 Tax=Candidatus Thiodiazotropha endoloripes TaxID=1818881 RepID=A0A1E2UKU6_9GAMM|nr:aspartate aminotransferase family protein [Candidatus Thiodiazotropha endoloripes]MCG7900653.1 aspartate aminotransferase family protein [Candidatus Thiodiazotropha weberae]MCG7992192.1 aspartate aminotransferase family protein [Candidatus Thiodiazotropha lotti]MCG7998697.1 aspartate aminotransferase family protein [Candidatus Thiodiazotropha lotti]MCW4183850.1 aspartate aminotransferase family protein [Candidatus Thiodiazotropha weberae]MCW4190463.1 aspartate aminotransferase family protei